MTKKNNYQIELSKRRKGASKSALQLFERESGRKIPSEYRKFLSFQDGGQPKRAELKYGKGPYKDTILRSFLSVFDLRIAIEEYADRIPDKSFPIAVDQFDNLILISNGDRNKRNQIKFWDHETELEGNTLIHVADTLSSFLKMLDVEAPAEELKVAIITFEDGVSLCKVLPYHFFSVDKQALVDVAQLTKGESVVDATFPKTIRVVSHVQMP